MPAEPRPSGTVVVVRDTRAGLEVLLLERTVRGEARRPGFSVFPGGRVEAADEAGDVVESARRAAVREAAEEAALELSPPALVPISRWITPELTPKRFDTWFFLARVEAETQVRVDGGEIAHHRWLSPREALGAHHGGAIRLAPPTFVTVHWLGEHARSADAARALARPELPVFRPRICPIEGEGPCILYTGDAGFEAGDPHREGPRHRLWMTPSGWRYECSAEALPPASGSGPELT